MKQNELYRVLKKVDR